MNYSEHPSRLRSLAKAEKFSIWHTDVYLLDHSPTETNSLVSTGVYLLDHPPKLTNSPFGTHCTPRTWQAIPRHSILPSSFTKAEKFSIRHTGVYLMDHSPTVTKSPFSTDTPPRSFTNVQQISPLGTPLRCTSWIVPSNDDKITIWHICTS